jgi:hypothetical protein
MKVSWRNVGIFAMHLVLTGCAVSNVIPTDTTSSKAVFDPELNVQTTRTIGEIVAARGDYITTEVLQILNSTSFGKEEGEESIMTCALTASPGKVPKKGVYSSSTTKADCFGPVIVQVTIEDGTSNYNCLGQSLAKDICRDDKGNYFIDLPNNKYELEQDFDNLRVIEETVPHPSNSMVVLVYAGKVSEQVLFMYREFSDDMKIPMHAQEVQLDLSKSNLLEIRGLQLEVIEASGTRITYRVRKNFQDW